MSDEELINIFDEEEQDDMVTSLEEVSQNIVSLPPKIQRFINLYLTGQYSTNKLAELLDVHPNTVYNWLKREDVKAIISDMQVVTNYMVGVQLKALSVKAVNKLSSLTDSPIDGVALQAVKDILDRAGHKPEHKIKVDKTVVTYEERLKDLIENTIEVDYEVADDEFESSEES